MRTSIENYENEIIAEKIELPKKNYENVFRALFLPQNGYFFELILRVHII